MSILSTTLTVLRATGSNVVVMSFAICGVARFGQLFDSWTASNLHYQLTCTVVIPAVYIRKGFGSGHVD
ncbi:Glutamyl-tRNA reductase [Dirofilaria immitis]